MEASHEELAREVNEVEVGKVSEREVECADWKPPLRFAGTRNRSVVFVLRFVVFPLTLRHPAQSARP